MKSLVLVTDAYGGRGGIAQYNRNLIQALCDNPKVDSVIAIPRSIQYSLEKMPAKLDYLTDAAGGKHRYLFTCIKVALRLPNVDFIICSHIHLLPIAFLMKLLLKCSVIPVIYGIEAWTPTSRWYVNYCCRRIKTFISIRKLTAKRFMGWAKLDDVIYYYLPNCIHEDMYGIAPKSKALVKRYGIDGRKVLMTAGRLDADEFERNKGFDEILEVLPMLRSEVQNITYMIIGDGEDKDRLVRKAETLDIDDIVIFTGYISEKEKADFYRLADVFAMPGSNKLFDRYPFRFVFIEALACGVPVVGCQLNDDQEANDPVTKQMIIQVDPNNPEQIKHGIMEALRRVKREIPKEMKEFFYEAFKERVSSIVEDVFIRDDDIEKNLSY